MLLTEVNKLLETQYMPMETGYCRLPDGQFYIAVLTRMPGCKARWLNWWFNTVIAYRTGQESKSNKNINKFLRKSKNAYSDHYGTSLPDGKTPRMKLHSVDISKYFDTAKARELGATIITCCDLVSPGNVVCGQVIHVARDTDYGCELRSRFWINNVTEENVRHRMEHFAADMGDLADFLKVVIEKIKEKSTKPNISCKFCYSDDVVKNGLRKSGQYWRCKTCGHCFMNNGALPNMKYPLTVVKKAVNEYLTGSPISRIRNEITLDTNYLPSSSSVYGWVKKLSSIATK